MIVNSTLNLDNPIWYALSNQHADFAQGDNLARRYSPDISPFGAVIDHNQSAFDSLAKLIPSGEAVAILGAHPDLGDTWELLRELSLVQMLYDRAILDPAPSNIEIKPLSQADVPAMLELVELTHPGPFQARTIELGSYLSIWQDGQLAAMAGERFHLPGYCEISAVCTHPSFQRRGYARQLILQLIHNMQSRAEIPFLHVFHENTGAIALYEKLGFKHRAQLPLYILKRR